MYLGGESRKKIPYNDTSISVRQLLFQGFMIILHLKEKWS